MSLLACVVPSDLAKQSSQSTQGKGLLSVGDGARAVSIIFLASNSGSYDAPTSSTVNAAGSGLQIQRIFKPNGELLASAGDSNWPGWLLSAEVMVSGPNNTAAPHQDCARFADPDIDGIAKCDFNGDGIKDEACGAPSRYLRVSELDCALGGTIAGTGGGTDGIALRLRFDRGYMKTSENVLAVLEYAASGLNESLGTPGACFTGNSFTPTNTDCSDHSYQVFLKRGASDVVTSFLTLVPPITGFVDTTKKRGGSKPLTREFYLPLASDTQIQYFQISRMQGLPPSATNFTARCGNNSPLCVGTIFYQLMLYRI